ncbi:hypothetical protein, partial [Thiolapillus sp.]
PNDWTPRLDAYFASPLALCARRVSSAASRLLGSTSLRFALHGWQRMHQDSQQNTAFHPFRLILVILAMLIGISFAAQWYSRNVTMPRYCEYSGDMLKRVREVLTEKTPAGQGDRKPYIIAARLTFLVPRKPDEPLNSYLARLQRHIDQQCP